MEFPVLSWISIGVIQFQSLTWWLIKLLVSWSYLTIYLYFVYQMIVPYQCRYFSQRGHYVAGLVQESQVTKYYHNFYKLWIMSSYKPVMDVMIRSSRIKQRQNIPVKQKTQCCPEPSGTLGCIKCGTENSGRVCVLNTHLIKQTKIQVIVTLVVFHITSEKDGDYFLYCVRFTICYHLIWAIILARRANAISDSTRST